jgi:hypothetical protein
LGRSFGLGGLQWAKVRKGRGQAGWAPTEILPKTDRKNKTFFYFFEIFPWFANSIGFNSNLNFERFLLVKENLIAHNQYIRRICNSMNATNIFIK